MNISATAPRSQRRTPNRALRQRAQSVAPGSEWPERKPCRRGGGKTALVKERRCGIISNKSDRGIGEGGYVLDAPLAEVFSDC
jgi:hypothetical protein